MLSMDEARQSLPVYPLRDDLVAAVKDHPVLVVVGETGRIMTLRDSDDELTSERHGLFRFGQNHANTTVSH